MPWSADVASVVGAAGVDALAIATNTGTHAELIVAAARSGLPVFCEKPVSLDRPSTVDTLAAVRSAGTLLQVGFHRRFDPDWVAATERIAAGELGDVYLFRTSLRDKLSPDPAFLGGSGGFFVDITIHDLDTARWMVGEVVEVTAHGAALSDPGFAAIGDLDTALVTLRFAAGALGSSTTAGPPATATSARPRWSAGRRRCGSTTRTAGTTSGGRRAGPRGIWSRTSSSATRRRTRRSWRGSPARSWTGRRRGSPVPTRSPRTTWRGRRSGPGGPAGPCPSPRS